MKIKNVSFYDFDQTITKQHTFLQARLEAFEGKPPTYIYNVGKEHAKGNMKADIKTFFKHDKTNLSAIATYHNNHAYVAGFVAVLLGKELTLKSVEIREQIIGLARYSVADTDLPFFICYIVGDDAVRKQQKLLGKNPQINLLRYPIDNINDDRGIINFFDDDLGNYKKAQKLPLITSHWIDAEKEAFVIKERFLCASALCLKEDLSEDTQGAAAAATTARPAAEPQRARQSPSTRFFSAQQRKRYFDELIKSTPYQTTL